MKTFKIVNQNGCCSSAKNVEATESVSNVGKALPIAIIGAGPIGLAAAAHLVEQKQAFLLLEAGHEIAHNIRTWGHVQLFSPWRYNINKAAKALLDSSGWIEPNLDTLPTGHELIDLYLKPLSELIQIKPNIHLNARVVGISREVNDKMKSKTELINPLRFMLNKTMTSIL